MAITNSDLRFYASQRMTDEDDGGGRMSAVEIISGTENSVFDDISDIDRAVGDVSLRKVYAAVTSLDTAKYLDAGIAVFKEPADPNVSVLAATTGSFYDEHINIQEYIETYLVQGPRSPYFLYENQISGALSITVFCRPEDEPPAINSTMKLIEFASSSSSVELYSQYVRFVRILLNEVQTFITDVQSGAFTRRVINCEISDALRYTFHGNKISKLDNLASTGMLYNCVVADVARYYGIRPVVTQAIAGDQSVYVDGIYGRIVPTSQIEAPILDADAAARRTFPAAANDGTIAFTVGDTLGPNFTLHVGRAIVPMSLSIAVSGGTLVDAAGSLKSGATVIGTVDYNQGIVSFAATSPSYSGSKTVTFRPAAPLTRTSNSFSLPVKENTRFRTYVANLKPLPDVGTLIVDFMSAGNWYRLQDSGNGILAGAAESYGGGTLNLVTGSVSITLGALPDINSSIIFTYGSGFAVYAVTGPTSLVIQLPLSVANGRTTEGSATLQWGSITLTDDGSGTLTGSGGTAILATDGITLRPNSIPAKDTVFTLGYEQFNRYPSFSEDSFPNQTADSNGLIAVQLSNPSPVSAMSVTFTVQATVDY